MLSRFVRRALILAAVLFAPLTLPGAVSDYVSPGSGRSAAATQGAFEHGLLWRVERPSAAASHVFGTIHVADKRVTLLPSVVTR